MLKKTEPSSYIKSGKWDESTIDQVYEDLLDRVGDILDRVQLTGCRPLFDSDPLLGAVRTLFELMEKELLVQWKIKQDEGVEKLFAWQRRWLQLELRSVDGLFVAWNRYCFLLWKVLDTPVVSLDQDPWKAFLLGVMTDRQSYSELPGVFNSDQGEQILGRVCGLFEKLWGNCPYHLLLSFLNLIELGTGKRPDINEPGAAASPVDSVTLPSNIGTFFKEPVEKGQWDKMPAQLRLFWKSHSENDPDPSM